MQNQVTLTSFTAHNNDLNKEPKVSKILSSVFWNMAAWATLAPNFVHSEWNRGNYDDDDGSYNPDDNKLESNDNVGREIDCNARKARALDNHAAADDDDD